MATMASTMGAESGIKIKVGRDEEETKRTALGIREASKPVASTHILVSQHRLEITPFLAAV